MKPIRSGRSTATASGPGGVLQADLLVGDQQPLAGQLVEQPARAHGRELLLERPVHLPVEDALALEDEPAGSRNDPASVSTRRRRASATDPHRLDVHELADPARPSSRP